jgi:hypothetical protein
MIEEIHAYLNWSKNLESVFYKEIKELLNSAKTKINEKIERYIREKEIIDQAEGIPKKEDKSPKSIQSFIRHFNIQSDKLKWENLTITFIDQERIKVSAAKHMRIYHFSELGFKYKKIIIKEPDTIWITFKILAKLLPKFDNGIQLINTNIEKFKKNISVLRKRLNVFIGLNDDPFYPYYRKEKKDGRPELVQGYKPKFRLLYKCTDKNELNEEYDINIGE